MNIRRARIEDAKDLNNLLTQLIQDEKQYDSNIDPDFVVTDFYEHYIDDPTRLLIVAEEDEFIVGYLYGIIKENDETLTNKVALLDALYIDASYRGKGIANNLIKEFKKWAIDNKVNALEVSVCSKNIKAKNLYHKHNFITTKETLICKINNSNN